MSITKHPRWRRLAFLGGAVVVIAALAISIGLDDGDPLAVIERTTEPACGQHRDGQSLFLTFRASEPGAGECPLAIRSAMAQIGWPPDETDAVTRAEGGTYTLDGVMLLAQSTDLETTSGAQVPMTFVQILDCRRSLFPTDPQAWSDGLSRDLFLFSPCDDAKLPIIIQP